MANIACMPTQATMALFRIVAGVAAASWVAAW